MLNLSTDDFRLIAERLLEDVDPKKYGLDNLYITDLRDALLNMVKNLETTGEFDMEISEDGRTTTKESSPPDKNEKPKPKSKQNPTAPKLEEPEPEEENFPDKPTKEKPETNYFSS